MGGWLRRLLTNLPRRHAPSTAAGAERLPRLERALDYRFRNRTLLVASLVHRSYNSGTETRD